MWLLFLKNGSQSSNPVHKVHWKSWLNPILVQFCVTVGFWKLHWVLIRGVLIEPRSIDPPPCFPRPSRGGLFCWKNPIKSGIQSRSGRRQNFGGKVTGYVFRGKFVYAPVNSCYCDYFIRGCESCCFWCRKIAREDRGTCPACEVASPPSDSALRPARSWNPGYAYRCHAVDSINKFVLW